MSKPPPRLCRRIFEFFIPLHDHSTFLNGIEEVYQGIRGTRGRAAADFWFWGQLYRSLPRFISTALGGYFAMLHNNLKTGIRAIRRHKGFSALNIMGLAVGLAVCILIFLWVQDELSYDRFHIDTHRLFRVIEHEDMTNGDVLSYSQQAPELAGVLKAEYPEIEDSTRFDTMTNRLVRYGERQFYENRFGFADPAFLTMFNFPLRKGSRETALEAPSSILITREMAEKYFGETDPVGETLQVDNSVDYTVSGVLEDIPSNSTMRFDFLAPFESIEQFGMETSGWGSFYLDTYIKLAENADWRELNPKLKDVIDRHSRGSRIYCDLQPMTRIRLYSNAILTPQVAGDIKHVVIFSLIAVFILMNACINFMNLTTARSGQRAREIGLRKVVGARRRELIRQFFGESTLMAVISLLFAVGMVILILPYFNQLSGKTLELGVLGRPHVMLAMLGIMIFTGFSAGSYPAIFLSAFQPAAVLKSGGRVGPRGGGLRRALVIFQFVMTTALIIGTVVVIRQLNYLRSRDLGFDKDQVMCLRLPGGLIPKLESLRAGFEREPGVIGTTAASTVPGRRGALLTMENWEGRDSEDRIEMGLVQVDDNFLSTFQLEVADGRFFSREFSTDKREAVIVNEAAVRAMNMMDPLGKWALGQDRKIIGVIKDFHLRSLHHKVAPLMLIWNERRFRYVFVKIAAADIQRTIRAVEKAWASIAPQYPFEFQFLDERLDELYRADRRMGRIINVFAGLALFVACLGLFGLASFVAERRTKEIGIRKVLGASSPMIFALLARDFIKWVLIANLIAAPVTAFAMIRYLRTYAYHTDLGPVIFLIPAAMTLVVALLTVSWQALRAANANPVRSLRYE